MKTIEERAEEFCENNICVECNGREDCNGKYLGGYTHTGKILWWLIQSGKSERDKLTRWNDPKENMPEPNHDVLTKWRWKDGSGEIISVGGFNGEEWGAHAIVYPELFDVIGWREIHE